VEKSLIFLSKKKFDLAGKKLYILIKILLVLFFFPDLSIRLSVYIP